MRVTIYLNAIESDKTGTLQEIRAQATHSLLALASPSDGIFLYDRRTRQQHAIKWSQLVEMIQSHYTLDEVIQMYQSAQEKKQAS